MIFNLLKHYSSYVRATNWTDSKIPRGVYFFTKSPSIGFLFGFVLEQQDNSTGWWSCWEASLPEEYPDIWHIPWPPDSMLIFLIITYPCPIGTLKFWHLFYLRGVFWHLFYLIIDVLSVFTLPLCIIYPQIYQSGLETRQINGKKKTRKKYVKK